MYKILDEDTCKATVREKIDAGVGPSYPFLMKCRCF